MKILKVDGVDNRGDEEVAFGYVYFTDGARISYHNTTDPQTGETTWNVGGSGGGHWPELEEWHEERALTHLRKHGAKMPNDAAA
jgi:hypothetical protein